MDEFESGGKRLKDNVCFEDYVDISTREDKIAFRASSWPDKPVQSQRFQDSSSAQGLMNPFELMSKLSTQFPSLHWFLIIGGMIELLSAFGGRAHPNPYMFPSLAFIGLSII